MKNLNIDKRELSRNLNKFKKEGMIPGILYGPKIENTPVKMSKRELKKSLDSGETIFTIDSLKRSIMVKIGDIQKDPVTREPIHFSVVQMPEGKENTAVLPIKFTGTPKGQTDGGVFMIVKDEIKISGLPKEMPKAMIQEVSEMEIGDKITVQDLELSDKIEILEEKDEVLAVCVPPTITKEEEIDNEETVTEVIQDEVNPISM